MVMNNVLGVHVARCHTLRWEAEQLSIQNTLHMYRSHQGSCNGWLGDITDAVYTTDRHTHDTGGGSDCVPGVLFDTQKQSQWG